MSSEISAFEKVIKKEAFTKSEDRDRFLAFMFLQSKYPDLTYWSMDGYSCDALADYTKMLVWRDSVLIDWNTKKVIKGLKNFHKCTMTEIIDIWENIYE